MMVDLNRLQDVAPRAAATRYGGRAAAFWRAAYQRFGKRALDLTLVVLAAPIVVPVILMLALCVAADGHSPFYVQKRIGRGGRIFNMWKLRSMIPDAEIRLEDYLGTDPEARQEWNNTQKLKRDPRITELGRIIRKSSLDELPQLWNVVTGEMSLVGPRPMMPSQEALYPGAHYFELRPGITGYWQISERNDCDFADRARFDSAYARDLGLTTDLAVLVCTVGVVVRGTGY